MITINKCKKLDIRPSLNNYISHYFRGQRLQQKPVAKGCENGDVQETSPMIHPDLLPFTTELDTTPIIREAHLTPGHHSSH